MGILDELQEEMKLLDKAAEYDGYSISGVMTILVCGMLCGLQFHRRLGEGGAHKGVPSGAVRDNQNLVSRAVLQPLGQPLDRLRLQRQIWQL